MKSKNKLYGWIYQSHTRPNYINQKWSHLSKRRKKKEKTQNNWKIIKLTTIIVTTIVSIVKTVAIIKTIIVTMIITTAKK